MCFEEFVCLCMCLLMSKATLGLCSVGLSLSDDTLKEKRILSSGRGQQFGLALWGQVLQVMSAPNWGGQVLPPLHGKKEKKKKQGHDGAVFFGLMPQYSILSNYEISKPNNAQSKECSVQGNTFLLIHRRLQTDAQAQENMCKHARSLSGILTSRKDPLQRSSL